jgi:branched-chain amino acid transport system substrate-binding protein
MEKTYFVYLLASERNGTLYTGVTGVLSFDGKGDLLKPAFTMMTFKGGQRVTASVVR